MIPNRHLGLQSGIVKVATLLVSAVLLLTVQKLSLILAHERLRHLDASSAKNLARSLSIICIRFGLIVLMAAERLRGERHAYHLSVLVQRGCLPLPIHQILLHWPSILLLLSYEVTVLWLYQGSVSVVVWLPRARRLVILIKCISLYLRIEVQLPRALLLCVLGIIVGVVERGGEGG